MIKIVNNMFREYNNLIVSYKDYRVELPQFIWALLLFPFLVVIWLLIWFLYSMQYFLVCGGYLNIYDELKRE